MTVDEFAIAGDGERNWLLAPEGMSLAAGEVHLWRADLGIESGQRQGLLQTLSADERERAARFHFDRDRDRFIAARGILRAILGRYLSLNPAQVQFTYSPHGKPSLANDCDGAAGKLHPPGQLCFNLSHANDLALYAVAWNCRIGIDLEFLRPLSDLEKLAERFFSTGEATAIKALALEQRPAAFFRCWTGREAYLKATGEGLAGLETVELSLKPGSPVRLHRINGDADAVADWLFQPLDVAVECRAALVVEGPHWKLRQWQWQWRDG